jgi:hypothetical protein
LYEGAKPPRINYIVKRFDVLSLLYHVPFCHNMKPKKKVTNDWASEYDISIAFSFSIATIGELCEDKTNLLLVLPLRDYNKCFICQTKFLYIHVYKFQFFSDCFKITIRNLLIIYLVYKSHIGLSVIVHTVTRGVCVFVYEQIL